jgi:hypothetical protein
MKRIDLSAVAFALGIASALAAAASAGGMADNGKWVSLTDGKSFAGWTPNERPESWAVEKGAFVSKGDRSHLFYTGPVGNHEFKNFELALEVMANPGSNGGIFIHTKMQGPGSFPTAGYELQVINSNRPVKGNAYVEHKMTGSIYAIRNTWKSPVRDNEWFRYRIKVSGKTIQTYINDVLTCEYTEPENPWRAADKKDRLLGSGTFALQAHDPGSTVRYRNIKVRLLPDASPSLGTPLADREMDELVSQLANDNFPLIDLGLVPSDGAATDAFNGDLRRYGITPGSVFALDVLRHYGRSVFVVNDRDNPIDPATLVSARSAGAKFVFSSGGESKVDETRLKARLLAIKAAKLAWSDFWVPGKN